MKKQTISKNNNFISFLINRSKEIFGIILISYAIFQFLALLTYHPLDPTLYITIDNKIINMMGKYGSYTASFLLEYFGYASYLIIEYAIVWGFFYIKKNIPSFFLLRLSALLGAIIVTSFLLTIITINTPANFISYGGIVGVYLKFLLYNYTSIIISFISALILFLICFNYAHAIKINNSIKTIKLIFIFLLRILKNISIFICMNFKKLYKLSMLFLQKSFNKRRIKDIESGYDSPKEVHTKIDKEVIPKLSKVLYDYKLPELDLLEVNLMKRKIYPIKIN